MPTTRRPLTRFRLCHESALCAAPASFLPLAAATTNYLCATPISLAVFRLCELRRLSDVELRAPIVDLGCGAGQFVRLAMAGRVEIGVDISPRQAAGARRSGRYERVVEADAAELPLADESVGTVLAVSSLEHMRRPEKVLAEAGRVLQPGGVFAATIVLPELRSHLYYSELTRRMGIAPLGRLYCRLHDWAFAHRTLLPQGRWEQLAEDAGLEIVTSRRFFSPAITRSFDFWLPPAVPYRLLAAAGMPLVVPLPWRRRIVEGMLAREERSRGNVEDGTLLFLLARKRGTP
ncbi:MAG: methyltransferase domain-containing protein [Planctomycetia bacterium]|nr:methyltransferase domain-containing protein [Planctomycetia bacterium]